MYGQSSVIMGCETVHHFVMCARVVKGSQANTGAEFYILYSNDYMGANIYMHRIFL